MLSATAPRTSDRGMKFQLGVPLPENHEREEEHIRHCTSCQAIWPAYYTQQLFDFRYTLAQITDSWSRIPEYKRLRLQSKLMKWQLKLFKQLKTKTTGRHIFFQMNFHRFFDEDSTYQSRLTFCNAHFTALEPIEKAYYDTLGRMARNDGWLTSPDTPKYIKRQYRIHKKNSYKSPLKKPRGAYHEFMHEQQRTRPELANVDTIELAKLCREPYSKLPPEEVERYKKIYYTNMEQYKKQDLIERFKYQEKCKLDLFTKNHDSDTHFLNCSTNS
jgi:hypothetical protein